MIIIIFLITDRHGNTLLHFAARNPHAMGRFIQECVGLGTDINVQNNKGLTSVSTKEREEIAEYSLTFFFFFFFFCSSMLWRNAGTFYALLPILVGLLICLFLI
jgi:hypothetical protein